MGAHDAGGQGLVRWACVLGRLHARGWCGLAVKWVGSDVGARGPIGT